MEFSPRCSIIRVPQFDIYRPREAVIDDIPEDKALWFLDAYDMELYNGLFSKNIDNIKWMWTG